ncbi:DUF3265 domain-containing protein [Vibrio parahaemolyticus]|nr:DUF3265 domain-containing protein [Vibrio parahaemolyticus]EHR6473727.1 DUF3265 domain-containing protein [Vibrio parahaemolyticus]EHZ7319012.1 DUF3265 domain-containing protein [Vibrio parahaemolyticus]EIA4667986.1 DUF3265 domain-containing protein [Vibrio parahaemolyticus]EIC2728991.1 DUF3265 domain-containing protein [Vibrio parahaemolyticus]
MPIRRQLKLVFISTRSIKNRLTRRLRGIHAAWHFWYAVSFGGESGLRKVGLCGIHPLTRRYD